MSGRVPFHPAAWLAWTGCAVAMALSTSNPVPLAVMLAALTFTATALGGDRGPYALMIKIGLAAMLVRVVLFGLVGHPGGSVLFTMPQVHLPALLGGFALGGDITAEVLAHSAIEGLRLAVVLACFGVALSVIEPARALRLAPRFLFEAGLVVAIGVSFVPWLVRTARDVRDAQRLRGVHGPRAAAALAIPILAATLDHAAGVAESMESRGYGRARGDGARDEARARAGALAAAAALAGFAIALSAGAGPRWLGWAGVATAGTALAALCVRLGAASQRTRYRRERLGARDAALAACALVATAAFLAARRVTPDAFDFSAYPALAAPAAAPVAVLCAAAVAAPVAVAARASGRLRRASRPLPAAEPGAAA